MTAADDIEAMGVVQFGAGVIHVYGQGCVRGGDVEGGNGAGAGADGLGEGGGFLDEVIEDFEFESEGFFACRCDVAFEFGQLRGGEAGGVGHGLAVDVGRFCVIGEAHHRVGVFGGDFDEIAEDVVEFDFEAVDAGVFLVLVLQVGDEAAALVFEGFEIVEALVVAARDEAAVAGEGRGVVVEGFGEGVLEIA